ncbi:MAG: TetR family transcriptional regulator [Nocardioidaceae bacterium]
MAEPRGRRPSGSGTREAILAAAKERFATVGYPRTTLRAVARDAGVDVRLVTHYFGSKQELFIESVELPFEPEVAFDVVLGPGLEGVGERLARFILAVLDTEAGRQTMTGLLRAAASEEEAAGMVRRLLVERMLGPLAQRLGTDQPELRASLMGSQVAGLAMARHVVALPALAAASPEQLAAALAPVFEHYISEPLPEG